MDSSTSSVRRPCFIEEDDGLASIAEFSGAGTHHHNLHQRRRPFFSRNGCYSAVSSSTVVPRRTGSLKNLASLSSAPVSHCFSPRSGRISDSRFDEVNRMPHFLEACFLCKKPLGGNRDIFMYRGDTPFCSEECRTEQIEMDETREKSLSLSASMKAMRSVQKDSTSAQENATSSPDKSQKYRFRAGTVAAA